MFKKGTSKEQQSPSNQTNLLVSGTVIKGDVITESNIRVDGKLIGNLKVNGKLVLGQNGIIEGEVICLNASIEGELKGNIKVDGLLVLKETSRIEGNINTHKIGVLEGAQFTGNCIMNSNSSHQLKEEIKLEEDTELVY